MRSLQVLKWDLATSMVFRKSCYSYQTTVILANMDFLYFAHSCPHFSAIHFEPLLLMVQYLYFCIASTD